MLIFLLEHDVLELDWGKNGRILNKDFSSLFFFLNKDDVKGVIIGVIIRSFFRNLLLISVHPLIGMNKIEIRLHLVVGINTFKLLLLKLNRNVCL